MPASEHSRPGEPSRSRPLPRGRWGLALASVLPPALHLATVLYVRQYEGWGAWAAAPLFLVPLTASVAVMVIAGFACWTDYRRGRPVGLTVGATLVGGSPALWFALRLLVS